MDEIYSELGIKIEDIDKIEDPMAKKMIQSLCVFLIGLRKNQRELKKHVLSQPWRMDNGAT